VAHKFCFALMFLCYYTHANRSIVSIGPRIVGEFAYEKDSRVSASN
jgi:hypothetical protein